MDSTRRAVGGRVHNLQTQNLNQIGSIFIFACSSKWLLCNLVELLMLSYRFSHPNWYTGSKRDRTIKTEIHGLQSTADFSIQATTNYRKSCWLPAFSFSHSKHSPCLDPLRPKMATRCLLIDQMETITFSVVIRGHGYKFLTVSLVPFAGHRWSYMA